MTPGKLQRWPIIAVFCRCGAKWFGKYAVDNPVIKSHQQRCGPMVTAAEFERLGHEVKWPTGWNDEKRTEAERRGFDR